MSALKSSFQGKRLNLMILAILTALSLGLIACDSHQNKDVQSIEAVAGKFEQTTVLQGFVSNNKRRLKAGAIKATDSDNRLVAVTTLKTLPIMN